MSSTNAWNTLHPGGVLVMTCATDPRPPHSAIDGWDVRPGEWYANVPSGEADRVDPIVRPGLVRVEVGLDRGDLYFRVDKPAVEATLPNLCGFW